MPAGSSETRKPQASAEAVLNFAWGASVFTASDVMQHTALSRSTAIAACDELVAHGWLRELENARSAGSEYRKGRPARRYTLNDDFGCVIGIDAGAHSVTAIVADLRGRPRAVVHETVDAEAGSAEDHVAVITSVITQARSQAAAQVLCIVVAVPAPVDQHGLSPQTQPFWQLMNPQLIERLASTDYKLIVDNDANLAAIAEGACGLGAGASSYVTLLTGERMGAGYVVDGRLIRGRGQVGELQLLTLVEGVGSSDGIAAMLRLWATQLHTSGALPQGSVLGTIPITELDAEAVFAAADEGDPAALELLERGADRLARICALFGGLLDVEKIILAGAVASSLTPLLARSTALMAEYIHSGTPHLVASELGGDVVALGAVTRAVEYVREAALEIHLLRSAPDDRSSSYD